jgi:elongation factor Ts
MAEITAALVKELRELTGLPMMDCKKALAETNGDLKKAEELLRIKSGAKAGKAAGRVAAEGVIAVWVSPDAKVGTLAEVNCETDFVAKNEDFLAFAAKIAEVVAAREPGPAEEEFRQKLVQKIGENITVRRFERIQAKGKLAQYVHGGKIGVLVDYEGDDATGKDVAMHISFAKPAYMAKVDVPKDVADRERGILAARAAESGKPAEIVAKMVEGGLNKFIGEQTLLGQPFIKDDKQSVEKMLAAKKTKVFGYRFLVVGEGIEKKQSDFAAEVAAMAR